MKCILPGIIGLCTTLVLACQQTPKFELHGELKNYTDSVIYLIASSDSTKIDTVKVNVGHFVYQTKLSEPTVYMINLGLNQNPMFFMAENGKMSLNYNLSDPMSLHIQGGPEQKLYAEYGKHCSPFYRSMDSLRMLANAHEQDPAIIGSLQQAFFSIDQRYKRMQLDFIQQHGNRYTAAFIADNYLTEKMDAGLQDAEKVYQLLYPEIQKSYYGNKIHTNIMQLKSTEIGAFAPEINVNNVNQSPITLSALKGKITLIDFWASWCGPCRKENPNLVKVYKKYNNQGLEILSVSLDHEREQWKKAIQQDKLTWLNGSDLMGWNSNNSWRYCIQQIPCNFLIDKDGRILAKNLFGEDLQHKLEEILN